MTIEERFERLERTNRRYRWGIVITITLVAIAEIVATVILIGYYVPDVIRAKSFEVVNEEGTTLVKLGATKDDDGMVETFSAKGTRLVGLTVTKDDNGMVTTSSAKGTTLVKLGASEGNGVVATFGADGGMRVFPGQ